MTTTLLTNRIQKSLKGHLSSTIRIFLTKEVKKNEKTFLEEYLEKKNGTMGVYIVLKRNPRGKTLAYVGATTHTGNRFNQHRYNLGNRGLAFFQVVEVPSSPMLTYIEQITLNTLRGLVGDEIEILNVRQPAFDCVDKNTNIKGKLVQILNRFNNGERGFILS